MKTLRLLLACVALVGLTAIPVFAQGNAFTYQGVLTQSGAPVNGTNDLTFTLYNAFIGGSIIGNSNVVNDLVITNGLFTVTLDFGQSAFDGTPRSLQIAVRPGASTGAYTNLEPRLSIRPTPYAIYASGASASGLRGTIGGSQIASGAIGPVHLSNSVSLWNRSGNDIHYTSGNVGVGVTNPRAKLHVEGSGFFGTDGGSLDPSAGSGIRVFQDEATLNGNIFAYDYASSASRDLILQQPGGNVGIGSMAPATKLEVAGTVTAVGYVGDGSALTGINASQLKTGTVPVAALGNAWQVGGNAGTTPGTHFLGTTDNQPIEFRVNGLRAWQLVPAAVPNLVGGSDINSVAPGISGATIAGGGGGTQPNLITNVASYAVIGGGKGNIVGGPGTGGTVSVIAGGDRNVAMGSAAVVGGGQFNSAGGPYSVIPGGANNATASGATFAFAAGQRSKANHAGAFVWADSQNADFASTVSNQFNVRASGGIRFETGGVGVTVDGSAVLTSASNYALRSGGNTLTGNQFITGGNVGIGTTTPSASLEVVGGIRARGGPPGAFGASNNGYAFNGTGDSDSGLFSLGDGQLSFFINSAERVRLDPNGNVGIGITNPGAKLEVSGDITCVAVNITSDRNVKEQFKPVNAREVLDKVTRLPITEWQYKTQGDARHIGPMAQDFREAFGTGRDDKHITSVDADGVALAAIQGLNEKLEEKTREVDALKRNLHALTELVNKLAAQQSGGAK